MAPKFIPMTERKSLKRIITEAVLAQLPDQHTDIEQIMSEWWMTGRQEGLRLTAQGDVYFKLAEIEFFDCPMDKIPAGTWYSFILEINKKIKCPYYLHVYNKVEGKKGEPYVRIYDSKIAMMLSLYGDIHSYLESVPGRSYGHPRAK